jgi:hypothetical protein
MAVARYGNTRRPIGRFGIFLEQRLYCVESRHLIPAGKRAFVLGCPMPGCILQVAGSEFDPDSFLANSTLQAYKVWHRGEPMSRSGPRASRVYECGGFRCDVSDVYGVLSGQVEDAVQFLLTHRHEFERLLTINRRRLPARFRL